MRYQSLNNNQQFLSGRKDAYGGPHAALSFVFETPGLSALLINSC